MDINAQTPIREILAQRPRAVEVLEAVMGGEFWRHLDLSLEEVARLQGIDPAALIHRLSILPRTTPGIDFERAPLHLLLDWLALEHREYREADLPRLERALAEAAPEDFSGHAPLEELRESLHSFKIDFLLHMHEEEEFLFPKALRTEASVEHPSLSSESFRGSVGVYPPVMLHTPEYQIKELAASLVRKAGSSGNSPSPRKEGFRKSLEEFAARLVRHADLETSILLPRALALEKVLHQRMREASQAVDPA